jgi:hypothetical protein
METAFKNFLYTLASSLLIFILGYITVRANFINGKADWTSVKELNRETIDYVDKQDEKLAREVDNAKISIDKRLERIEDQNNELMKLIIKYSKER